MKLHDLLTKNATVELKHPVTGDTLGVSIVVKPNEDQGVKSVVRRELSNLPTRPSDEAKESDWLMYAETIEKSDRTILASRIVDVKGLDDFVNTEEAVLSFEIGRASCRERV